MASSTEPIPLRTLTTLLNYEKMISDPIFRNQKLFQSSVADPGFVGRGIANYPVLFKEEPATVHISNFKSHELSAEENLSTTCVIHPDASQAVQGLTATRLEDIYYESRAYNGCYKAVAVYQYFFELCSPAQELSIQISNEKPVWVKTAPTLTFVYKLKGPKLHRIASTYNPPLSMGIGSSDLQTHCVLGFPHQDAEGMMFIVDMSRRQYGAAGRGSYGENYFLGIFHDFNMSMKNICVELIPVETSQRVDISDAEENKRLKLCAQRVWDRWQNRELEGWCEHCGKGGKHLLRCAGCKTVKIRYCCRELKVRFERSCQKLSTHDHGVP